MSASSTRTAVAFVVVAMSLAGCGGQPPFADGRVTFVGSAPSYAWPVTLFFRSAIATVGDGTLALIEGTLSPAPTSASAIGRGAFVAGGVVEGRLADPAGIDPDVAQSVGAGLCEPATVDPVGLRTSAFQYLWEAENDQGSVVGLLLFGEVAGAASGEGFTVGDRLMGFVYADRAGSMEGVCQVGSAGDGGQGEDNGNGFVTFALSLEPGWNRIEAVVEETMNDGGDVRRATVRASDHDGGVWNWYAGGGLVALAASADGARYVFRSPEDGSVQAAGTSLPATVSLRPGEYSLCVVAEGFENSVLEPIVVESGALLDVTIELVPGDGDASLCWPWDGEPDAVLWRTELDSSAYALTLVPGGPLLVGTQGAHGSVVAIDPLGGEILWSLALEGYVNSRMHYDGDGLLYVPTYDQFRSVGLLHAVGVADGTLRWTATTDRTAGAVPVLWGDLVLLNDITGVHALDAETGELEWRYDASSHVCGLAVASEGVVFVPSLAGPVTALEAASGAVLWRVEGLDPRCSVSVDGERVYVGSGGSELYALDPATGELDWTATLSAPYDEYEVGRIMADAAGRVFANYGHYLHALDATSGSVLWVRSLPTWPTWLPPLTGTGLLYMASMDVVFAVDASTGTVVWYHPLDSGGGEAIVVSPAETVFVGDGNSVVALDPARGTGDMGNWGY